MLLAYAAFDSSASGEALSEEAGLEVLPCAPLIQAVTEPTGRGKFAFALTFWVAAVSVADSGQGGTDLTSCRRLVPAIHSSVDTHSHGSH